MDFWRGTEHIWIDDHAACFHQNGLSRCADRLFVTEDEKVFKYASKAVCNICMPHVNREYKYAIIQPNSIVQMKVLMALMSSRRQTWERDLWRGTEGGRRTSGQMYQGQSTSGQMTTLHASDEGARPSQLECSPISQIIHHINSNGNTYFIL